mmetsp:Transcript_19344/g.28607  ORF Transcript_19344/g.28607 Transcript_19344/m.28607 type:complete len:305 (-) Transcript_19344:10-924(-)
MNRGSEQESKALGYIAEGEKILNKKSIFGSIFGSDSQKYEDAAELFKKAANCFKTANNLSEAGRWYLKVAELNEKANSMYDAATAYVDASKCLKEENYLDSIEALKGALSHFEEMGQFNRAAKILKEIAEMYETNQNYEESKECFMQASNYFSTENATQSSNQCLLKVAFILSKHIDPPDYTKASKIFEDLGKSCLSVPILKMNAKVHFLQSLLCSMASNDTVLVRMKLENFKALDYSFSNSRECGFAEDLCSAVENFDSESFATVSFEFDKITPLDPWKTTLLVTIKRIIEGDVGGKDEIDLT